MSRQDFIRGDATVGAPQRAVRGPQDVGVLVAQDFSPDEAGTVGEDDVVAAQAFLGGRRGGDEEGGAGSELEVEDWAVMRREFGQSPVG